MARKGQTVLLSATMLSIGLAVGGHLDQFRLAARVEAVPESTPAPTMAPGSEPLVYSGEHIGRDEALAHQ